MAQKKQQHEEEDLIYEEDQGAELVKKLRTKLKKCEEEKKEYLDGWQRVKAEGINARKEESARLATARERAVESFIEELLPALDSFDMAFKDASWEKADPKWKQGIEYIHTQLLQVLATRGIESYGEVGEAFDPTCHDAAQKGKGERPGTILEVIQRGYKHEQSILRPARVIVAE